MTEKQEPYTESDLQQAMAMADGIDRGINRILFPDGGNRIRIKLIPYWNEETDVFLPASQPTYLATRALDLLEEFIVASTGTNHGLSKVLELYAAPKSERKAIADSWRQWRT